VHFADVLRQLLDVTIQTLVMLAFAFLMLLAFDVTFALLGLMYEIFRQLVHAGGVQMFGCRSEMVDLFSNSRMSLAWFASFCPFAFFDLAAFSMFLQLVGFAVHRTCFLPQSDLFRFVESTVFFQTHQRGGLRSQFIDLSFIGPRHQDKVSDPTCCNRQQS
jgi:hypothetical protein